MSDWDEVEIEKPTEDLGPRRPGLLPVGIVVGLLLIGIGFYFFYWENRTAPTTLTAAGPPSGCRRLSRALAAYRHRPRPVEVRRRHVASERDPQARPPGRSLWTTS